MDIIMMNEMQKVVVVVVVVDELLGWMIGGLAPAHQLMTSKIGNQNVTVCVPVPDGWDSKSPCDSTRFLK